MEKFAKRSRSVINNFGQSRSLLSLFYYIVFIYLCGKIKVKMKKKMVSFQKKKLLDVPSNFYMKLYYFNDFADLILIYLFILEK